MTREPSARRRGSNAQRVGRPLPKAWAGSPCYVGEKELRDPVEYASIPYDSPCDRSSGHALPSSCLVSVMTLPNKISLFRLLLIPAFVAALLAIDADRPQLRWLAAGIYVLAAFSDAVDGYLARRWQQTSELGALLDPLADKLLVNIALVFLAVHPYVESVPRWVPVRVLVRDATITGGTYLIHRFYGHAEAPPRPLGKLSTLVQNIAIPAIVLNFAYKQELLTLMILIVGLSLVDYVRLGIRQVLTPRAV